MLQVSNLHKAYGRKVLFEGVSFTMTAGERLGLVGRNGSGKTTLFRLITGQEAADDGEITLPRGHRVGYLSQHLKFGDGTVLEEACKGLPEQEGGWREDHRAEAALLGLGFQTSDFDRPPAELSGGFQVRLQLASVLVSEPSLLLLDEPTNYLDIVSIRWLKRFLNAWPTQFIVITHDRDFMDSVITHTMAISRRDIRRAKGDTGKLYDLLEAEEEIHEKTRQNEARSRKHAERFINRFRAKASKARAVQSRIKLLEKREKMVELTDEATLDFKFQAAPFPGKFVLETKDLTFGYKPDELLIKDMSLSVRRGDRVAIVGKNGKGKTTLLNLLDNELKPLQGEISVNQNIKSAHFGQNNIERLNPQKSVEEEILDVHPDHTRRAARGICGVMMFEGDDALKKVEVLSGGERARVLLGKLLVRPANLLLLDEPTNHLDMESVDSLITAVAAFKGTVIMVTHNQRVLHALATRLVVFDRGQVSIFEGTYRDFLDRVGWEDEQDERPAKKAKAKGESKKNGGQKGKKKNKKKSGEKNNEESKERSKKELRRMRAEIVNERSAALRKLKQRMERLETSIDADEKRLQKVNDILCTASPDGDDDILALSLEFEKLKTRIDSRFTEYHKLSSEHEERGKEFDRRLAKLDA